MLQLVILQVCLATEDLATIALEFLATVMEVLVHVQLATFLESLFTQLTALGNQGMLPNLVLLQSSGGSTQSTTDVAGKYCRLTSRVDQFVYHLVVPFQIILLGEPLATGHTAPACICSDVAVLL